MVAIDTGLPRRPPAFVLQAAQKSYPLFVGTLLAPHSDRAELFLREILAQPEAAASLPAGWPPAGADDEIEAAAKQLRAGMIDAIEALGPLTNWLQALYKALDGALADFFVAAEESAEIARLVDVEVAQVVKQENERPVARRNGGCILSSQSSERALLNFLLARLHQMDADVLVGHNIGGFDLDVLLHRLKACKVR